MRPVPRHLLRWYADPTRNYQALDRFVRNGGGNLTLEIMPHGGMEIVGKRREYADLGLRAKRLAARYGTHVRTICGIKTHVVKPDSRYDWSEHGFDYGWVASKNGRRWCVDLARFLDAGYTWELEAPTMGFTMPDGKTCWDKCLEARPVDDLPICEYTIDRETKVIRASAMVLDLRIAACREWLVDEWFRFQREIGMDVPEVGLKNMRYRHPAPPTLDPTDEEETIWKGTIHATPFGPSEWEASAIALLRLYESRGAWVVLDNQDPEPHPNDKWFWLEGKDRDLPLGESSGSR